MLVEKRSRSGARLQCPQCDYSEEVQEEPEHEHADY
jgi:DNA topoisomerase-1